MRYYVYISLIFAILPLVFWRPFFGLCAYLVVSLLQPKALCWNTTFQDAMLVGVPMIIGAIVFGVRRRLVRADRDLEGKITGVSEYVTKSPLFKLAWPIVFLGALVAYISVTRLVANIPLSESSTSYRALCKVFCVTALITGIACDLRRVRVIYVVVALAVAFWAIKGGLKVILLGPHQVYGKTYDNNLFALTSVMALPMVFYFGLSLERRKWRTIFMCFSGLICLAIIGSRSRAGFVALVVVVVGMGWSSRHRFRVLFAALCVGIAAVALSGEEVRQRVDSIVQYRSDKSARSRFETWGIAIDLLELNPLIGVGFGNFEAAKDQLVGGRKAAHNIYLQNLAELGLLGHPIWLAVVPGTLLSSWLFMRRSRALPAEMRWAYYWSRGITLAMAAFCVHGLFHNEQYLEFMFTLVGLNVSLQTVTMHELKSRRLRAAAQPARAKPRTGADTEIPDVGGWVLPPGLRSFAGRAICQPYMDR